MNCPRCKVEMEYDKSSKGVLVRCRICNLHLVKLPKEVFDGKDGGRSKRKKSGN